MLASVVDMKKMIGIALASIMAVTGLTACAGESDGIDSGVVIKKTHKRVTILEDDGETDKHKYRNSKRCKVGDRWPDCKR